MVQSGSFGYLLKAPTRTLSTPHHHGREINTITTQSLWDGQPVNLARHLVNLKETYTEHVSPSVVAYLETGVITERGKIYVHNHLHALMRTSKSFTSLPTAEKPCSFDNPAPGARFWRGAQEEFASAITKLRERRIAAGDSEPRGEFPLIITTGKDFASAITVTSIIWPNIFTDDYENVVGRVGQTLHDCY